MGQNVSNEFKLLKKCGSYYQMNITTTTAMDILMSLQNLY